MPTTGPRCLASIELAQRHEIKPARCKRCGQTERNWGGPTMDGTDQQRDTGDLIFQCLACGQYNALTEEHIRRRARATDQEGPR